jgi:hypothetical protein
MIIVTGRSGQAARAAGAAHMVASRNRNEKIEALRMEASAVR